MDPDEIVQMILYITCASLAVRLFPDGWQMWASLIFLSLLLLLGDDIQFHIIEKKTHHEDEI